MISEKFQTGHNAIPQLGGGSTSNQADTGFSGSEDSKNVDRKHHPMIHVPEQGLNHSSVEAFPRLFLPTSFVCKIFCYPHGYQKGKKPYSRFQQLCCWISSTMTSTSTMSSGLFQFFTQIWLYVCLLKRQWKKKHKQQQLVFLYTW